MKYNKWVFFYTVMVAGLLFFALYLSGVLNINLPETNLYKPTPDTAVARIQAYCRLEKYESIALHSLKYSDKENSRITKEDISGSGGTAVNYPALAKNICNAVHTGRKVEKKKTSDNSWEYRFYSGIVYEFNRVYKIVFIEGDWRFVLE